MKMKFGLEVECLHNSKSFTPGQYHAGNPVGEYWEAQSDSSIRQERIDDPETGKFKAGKPLIPTEFVLRKPITAEQLDDAIKELRKVVKNGRSAKFRDFEINSSCGAHIHFSPVKPGRSLWRQVPFRLFGEIRRKTYRDIQRTMPKVFPEFRKQYFRTYSKKLTCFLAQHDRHIEFHSTRNTGTEWRSFNLLGVSTWTELKNMYRIAFKAIESTFKDGPMPEMLRDSGRLVLKEDGDLLGIARVVIKNHRSDEFSNFSSLRRQEIKEEKSDIEFQDVFEIGDGFPDPIEKMNNLSDGIELIIGGEKVIVRPRM